MSIKPMKLTGAFVLKEFIVFVRSLASCNVRYAGRSFSGRLHVMGRAVRRRWTGGEPKCCDRSTRHSTCNEEDG